MKRDWNRREFLGAGLGWFGFGLTAPLFLGKTAWALRRAVEEGGSASLAEDRILVLLQLAGGNDGLNTVVPFRQDPYYKLRPQLAIEAERVLKAGDEFGFHPAAVGLKKLFDEGGLAVVHGVGYPNPNRSHFVSTDIWESADPEGRTYTGWLGRHLDRCCGEGKALDPSSGVAITQEQPLALQGESFSPICFESPEQLRWRAHPSNRGAERVFERLNEADAGERGEGPLTALDFVRKASKESLQSAEAIRRAAQGASGSGKAGLFGRGRTSLEDQLRMVLRMVQAGLKTRLYYVSLGGFDTHSGQGGRHQALMKELGDALASFAAQLRESRLEDRVLLMSFSEFGRRVAQNGSGGTDHGTAAPLFLVGGKLRGGFHGAPPRLDELEEGDLRFTTDFRSVYATVLEDWLGAPAAPILGEEFPKLPILKT